MELYTLLSIVHIDSTLNAGTCTCTYQSYCIISVSVVITVHVNRNLFILLKFTFRFKNNLDTGKYIYEFIQNIVYI